MLVRIILALVFFSLTQPLQATLDNLNHVDDVDEVATRFESSKRLFIINTQPEVRMLDDIRREIDEESARHDAEMGYDDFSEFMFLDSDYPETGDYVGGRDYRKEAFDSEQPIVEAIKNFIKQNGRYKDDIKRIWKEHKGKCEARSADFWPADVAIKIAGFFRQKFEVELALKFYRLAMISEQCFEHLYLSMSDTLVEYINFVLRDKHPGAPTPEIFTALVRAINYNDCDPGDGDVGSYGEAKNKCLIRHRDHMVRWPIAPQKVLNDQYYAANQLAGIIYGQGFIDRLLKSVDDLRELFSLRRFDASDSDKNIFVFLEKKGFICTKRFYQGAPQYILVNQNGLVVRIKRGKEQNRWQYTLGLLLKKPFEWDKSGHAVRAIKGNQIENDGSQFAQDSRTYDFVTDFQENEIIKISYHDGLVQILPSSFFRRCHGRNGRLNIDYWADYKNNGAQMTQAHFDIAPVGKYNKQTGRAHTRPIDAFCIGFDKRTGDVY